jgi:hypothetical protein
MFLHPAWKLNKFTEMETHCPVCDLQFEIEPGFFWGAMYVSYALTVAMMLIIGGAVLLLTNGRAGFWTYIIPIIGTLIICSPLTYRYARVVMLYFFSPVRFNPDLANKK